MKLSFPDVLSPLRFAAGVVFVGVAILGLPIASVELLKKLGWPLSQGGWLLCVALGGAWIFLGTKYDILSMRSMDRKKALAVSQIDIAAEKLIIRGHSGFIRTYPCRGLLLDKEIRPAAIGRPACYLTVQPPQGVRTEFFISYSEQDVDRVLAAFTTMNAAHEERKNVPTEFTDADRPQAEPPEKTNAAFASPAPRTTPSEARRIPFADALPRERTSKGKTPPSAQATHTPSEDQTITSRSPLSSRPKGEKDTPALVYLPLSTSGWVPFLMILVTGIFAYCTIDKLFYSPQTIGFWPALGAVTLSGMLATVTVILLIYSRKEPTRLWMTENGVRVERANGSVAEFTYTDYSFRKRWTKGPTLYIDIEGKDGETKESLCLGSNVGNEDVLETFFKELRAAQRKAKKKQREGVTPPDGTKEQV